MMIALVPTQTKNIFNVSIFRRTKVIVLILFMIWTSFSILAVPLIDVGLDQELSMAKDSHVVKYFKVGLIFSPF